MSPHFSSPPISYLVFNVHSYGFISLFLLFITSFVNFKNFASSSFFFYLFKAARKSEPLKERRILPLENGIIFDFSRRRRFLIKSMNYFQVWSILRIFGVHEISTFFRREFADTKNFRAFCVPLLRTCMSPKFISWRSWQGKDDTGRY